MSYYTNQTVRDALDHYLATHDVEAFEYMGVTGFEAVNLWMIYNDAWELEFVMAYLDQSNGIPTEYPALPELV